MAGTERLCSRCEAAARVEGSVEKMLAAKLKRTAVFFEPDPKLDLSLMPSGIDDMSEHDAWLAVCKMRWPTGQVRCPKCGSHKLYTLTAYRKFNCADPSCKHRFSAVSGTAFASFKKGYVGLLKALAHDGPGYRSPTVTAKSAYDVRRRKTVNE